MKSVYISDISLSRCISKPYFVLLYVRELFRCRFVPLLEPNPGDANVVTHRRMLGAL